MWHPGFRSLAKRIRVQRHPRLMTGRVRKRCDQVSSVLCDSDSDFKAFNFKAKPASKTSASKTPAGCSTSRSAYARSALKQRKHNCTHDSLVTFMVILNVRACRNLSLAAQIGCRPTAVGTSSEASGRAFCSGMSGTAQHKGQRKV